MEKREHILIIDDSLVQANMLKSILEGSYDITLAHDAEQGLQLARDGGFSLILLDVIMPKIDGLEILKTLQEQAATRRTPVILITGLNDVEHEELGLTLGAVDYITKPYHPALVKARVNTHIKLYLYQQHIERSAMLDPMTGVPNRRSYDACYLNKWQEAIRHKLSITLCMFDIDKFKVYNDTFGHPAGDKVIHSVARTAAKHLQRSSDFFARYGGEEFVAIITGGQAKDIFAHMKKLRRAVEKLQIPHSPEVSPWVTVSIGGVTVRPQIGDVYDDFLKIADSMLYDAKRFGRNQVVWFQPGLGQLTERRETQGSDGTV